MGMMINYFFYKNFVYTLLQILFSVVNCFSMQTVFPDMFLTIFNLVFTAWPIMAFAIWEKDILPITEKDGE